MKFIRILLYSFAALLTLRLVVIFMLSNHGPLHMPSQSIPTDPKAPAAPTITYDFLSPTSKLSEQFLFTETILSIIQTYYVDSENMNPEAMLNHLMVALKEELNFEFSLTNNLLTCTKDEIEGSFLIFTPLTVQNLTEVIIGLSAVYDTAWEQKAKLAQNQRKEESSSKKAEDKGLHVVLNQLLSSLDRHSALLSPDEYKDLKQGTEGKFGGLGLLVGMRNRVLTVIKPLSNSPALRAGIKPDDMILSINGVKTFNYQLDELVSHMRGEPGSKVDLSILRAGAKAIESVAVNREIISVNSVENKPHDDNFLHLFVESFSSSTSDEIQQALAKHRKKHGYISGLILDLRMNPGGLLNQAVKVADLFVKSGNIVSTKGKRTEVEKATIPNTHMDFPIVVLINEMSASAAEIVSVALKEHRRGFLIGQPSYGKGSVQTLFELPDSQALKLTIAKYFSPNSQVIQDIGVYPHVWTEPILETEQKPGYLFSKKQYKNHNTLAKLNKHYFENKLLKIQYMVKPEKVKDYSLNLATKILNKAAHKKQKFHYPAFEKQALSIALSEQKKHHANTSKFFKSKKVHWSKKALLTDQVSISMSTKQENFLPRDKVQFQYEVKNTSNQPLQRISVYLKDKLYSSIIKEIAIGKLAKNQVHKGKMEIEIPIHWEAGPYRFRYGVAINSTPIFQSEKFLRLEIGEGVTPTLKHAFTLVESGVKDGMLENQEAAKIKLEIKNNSSVIANNLHLELLNLSGSQISVKHKSQDISELKPGASTSLYFEVKCSELLSKQLDFGLFINGESLKVPIRKSHFIATRLPKKQETLNK